MKFKFWGVRGSIPSPGPDTVKYGGNTTCIEIRTDDNELIILDAGTGIHALGQSLLHQRPVSAHIFITHTHWDHIQGLPFFMPLFIAKNSISIYGGMDPVTGENISRALSVQLQYSYFPIREAQLNAQIDYHTVRPGAAVNIGQTRITPILLNHPVLNFGYRIDSGGRSLFFTGDYEVQHNIYQPRDAEFDGFQHYLEEKQKEVALAMQDVDALVVDASFTGAEAAGKRGWGHGSYDSALALAAAANAKRLYFTHHEPVRTDAELDAIYQALLQKHPDAGSRLFIAQEGAEISL